MVVDLDILLLPLALTFCFHQEGSDYGSFHCLGVFSTRSSSCELSPTYIKQSLLKIFLAW